MKTKVLSFIFLLFFAFANADELTVDPPIIIDLPCPPCLPEEFFQPAPEPPEITVDLVDPLYEDGVLTTTSGGILNAPGLRIQAQNIQYTRKLEEDNPTVTVSCQGHLLVDYKQWTLVGDSFFYDFVNQKGYLINGRTASPPWVIGGAELLLTEMGTLIVHDGYLTTSEGEIKDVVLMSPLITLYPDQRMVAKHLTIRLNEIPLFWLPTLQLNLDKISRSPFAVKFGWGGFKGSYISLLYRFLSWKDFEATARLDGFFGKGVGAGIETAYNPSWRATKFYTRNYYAHDLPIYDPQRKDRYRFQGSYYDEICGATVNGIYDIVSDGEMAADYVTHDFDLQTAGRTQLTVRKKRAAWLANFFTRVRVNNFQTVNQELPSFQFHLHPFELPGTGAIFENNIQASYLNYVLSDAVINQSHNFSSARLAAYPKIYRPISLGPIIATPEAGLIGIAYSNSPSGGSVGQGVGELGMKLETTLSRPIGCLKHVLEPYLHYHYLTTPRVQTDRHFIFTIYDGLDRLNQLRFGLRNSIFNHNPNCIPLPLHIEIWANAFFATPTVKKTIPKGYLKIEWQPHPFLFSALESSWNFEHNQIDFCNVSIDWTFSKHLALGLEFRHRGPYDWRKADFYNFILESVRSEKELLASPLSDKRKTILFRLFTRFHPDWTLKLDLRHGWNRKWQEPYLEYQIEMTKVLFQNWYLTVDYEKRQSDSRFSFSILLKPAHN